MKAGYPFLWPLASLAAGILCGEVFSHEQLPWLGIPAIVWLWGFWNCRYHRRRRLFRMLAGLCFACMGYMLMYRYAGCADSAFPDRPVACKVRILEPPSLKRRHVVCRALEMEECRDDTVENRDVVGRQLLLYISRDSAAHSLRMGDELCIRARLLSPVNPGNPCEFDYVRYLRHQGIGGMAYVSSGSWRVVGQYPSRTLRQLALACREKVMEMFRRNGFEGDALSVLSALTVGDRLLLDEDIRQTYSVTGAAHVLALSGLHVGLIYLLCFFLSVPLWKCWRFLKPFLLSFLLLFLWAFAFLTGLPSSVVRAVTMCSLLLLAGLCSEKPLTLNSLSATAFLMLVCRPVWLFDVGFQLSFLAVAAILLIQPRLYALYHVRHRLLRPVWRLVTVSVAAQLGVAPLVAFYFHSFSTCFLLTNLWVIPLVSLILYAAVAFLLLVPFPDRQALVGQLLQHLLDIQQNGLRRLEQLPWVSVDGIWLDVYEVWLFYLSVGAFLYAFRRKTYRSVCMALWVCLLSVVYHSWTTWSYRPERSLVFYNVRGCPTVHCLTSNTQSWLICTDTLSDMDRLKRQLSPYWYRLHLKSPQVVGGTYRSELLSLKGPLLNYAGKTVFLLQDDHWRNKTVNHPLPVDYLYVFGTYKGGIRELGSLLQIRRVVLDASLPDTVRKKLIRECTTEGIPCWSLSEKGFLHIPL